MDMKLVGEISGYVAATIGAFVFFPQVIQSWKSKNTKDVSFLSFLLISIVSALWTVYGIANHALPIILVNIVIFILSVIMLFLKRKYG